MTTARNCYRLVGLALQGAGLWALGACSLPDTVPFGQGAAGQAEFAANCAACHGQGARGGAGPDLTTLAVRNGGVFPMQYVLDQVDGYSLGNFDRSRTMPQMGHLMDGALVRVDLGDGVSRPVPTKIVATARYLQSLQAEGD
jgi:mono/diheme cytochrome c family protein